MSEPSLRNTPPIFVEHGDRIEVTWPGGRGLFWTTPEAVEGWAAQINELRAERDRLSDRGNWPTQQQWAAFCGGDDPDDSAHLELFDDPAEAEEITAWLKGGQVAARQVAYGPWTKPYQPGDMDRAEAANAAVAQCCDLHNTNCEPPSELCCHSCTEATHPDHPPGVPCVLTPELHPTTHDLDRTEG